MSYPATTLLNLLAHVNILVFSIVFTEQSSIAQLDLNIPARYLHKTPVARFKV